MIVVSDASPLNYLALIGAEHVLPTLFGSVLIPPRVLAELTRSETPARVRSWALQAPDWLVVQRPANILPGLDLDAGETEAISLSLEVGADAILIDDRKGRLAAAKQGLTMIGAISVLELAARRGLLSLPAAFDLLGRTNFRASPQLLADALQRHHSDPSPKPDEGRDA